MSSTAPHGHAHDSPSGVRPLPPRPRLEYERKQAKHLLRRVHEGDSDALTRVRAHRRGGERTRTDEIQLSDAQFTIAREYGFVSWPKLVDYFTTLERHMQSARRSSMVHRVEMHEGRVESILAMHRNRRVSAAQFLATFVPRFYNLTVQQILDAEVTVDDARLVVARENWCPSWEVLLELANDRQPRGWAQYESPRTKAYAAVKDGDLESLVTLVDSHPELLESDGQQGDTVLRNALVYERRERTAKATAVVDWILARGGDPMHVVDRQLLGWMRMTTDDVQFALDRGADPTWLPPNGIPVLEHALVRYWNGDAVDMIASRVTPREAFWIAAGVGDTRSFDRYIDKKGRVTDAARRDRPDFTAMSHPMPSMPEADDLEIIWEAFFIAGLNGRVAVLDAILERGFPIDHAPWESGLIHFAVGNRMVRLVEYLVSRGVNLDRKGWHPDTTAREAAEVHVRHDPKNPDALRILELCGGRSPDVVLKSYAERTKGPVVMAQHFHDALAWALDDAARLELSEAQPDSLLLGLLAGEAESPFKILSHAGVDPARLRQLVEPRLDPPPAESKRDTLWSAAARDIIEGCRADAERRRCEVVTTPLLLWMIAGSETGAADILRAAGADLQRVREICVLAL